MNVFIRAMVKIFSSVKDGKFHLSPHENIFTIALINIHYLYNSQQKFNYHESKKDVTLYYRKQKERSSSFSRNYLLLIESPTLTLETVTIVNNSQQKFSSHESKKGSRKQKGRSCNFLSQFQENLPFRTATAQQVSPESERFGQAPTPFRSITDFDPK